MSRYFYFFIYIDNFLDRKYNKIWNELEARLTNFKEFKHIFIVSSAM